MTGSIGRLTNAPLVYVLCQVRFSAVTAMEGYVEGVGRIQERLRDKFPLYASEFIHGLRLQPGGGSALQEFTKRWVFKNKENTTGLILNTDQLVIHTTDYQSFEPFLADLLEAVTVLKEHAKVALVQRIGLRYIDQIVPRNGQSVDDYVQTGLTGCDFGDTNIRENQSRHESRCLTSLGHLHLRYYKARGLGVVPDDLMPLELSTYAKDYPNDVTGMIDTDHFSQFTMDFDSQRIGDIVTKLHDGTSAAFKAAVTPFALREWGQNAQ